MKRKKDRPMTDREKLLEMEENFFPWLVGTAMLCWFIGFMMCALLVGMS